MIIECNYELVVKYAVRLKELGYEIPNPCLIDIDPCAAPTPETIAFEFCYDYFDRDHDLKVLKLFIELIEKGAEVEDDYRGDDEEYPMDTSWQDY